MSRRRALRLRPFLGLALSVTGCTSEPTFGRVYGSLEIPDCDEDEAQDRTCSEDVPRDQCEAFDLEVTFFALQFYPDNSAKLRFQAGGSDFALTDGLLFDIRDTRQIRGRLGMPLTVGRDENIRSGLGLFELCPDSTQSYELRGSITFDEFGIKSGDRISGT